MTNGHWWMWLLASALTVPVGIIGVLAILEEARNSYNKRRLNAVYRRTARREARARRIAFARDIRAGVQGMFDDYSHKG